MNVFQSYAMPEDNTALLINKEVLTLDILKQAEADLFGPPKSYDESLVPEGHIPKLQLREFWWMDKEFIYNENNKLIKLFGTKPKPAKFIPRTRYDTAILPPSAISMIGSLA